jgi:hypothetical protein
MSAFRLAGLVGVLALCSCSLLPGGKSPSSSSLSEVDPTAPKKAAQEAIKWGFDYCKTGLNPDNSISVAEENLEKFQTKLKIATDADPSIRDCGGKVRGLQVNEWIAKCEKDLPARIAGDNKQMSVENAVTQLAFVCDDRDPGLKNFKAAKAKAVEANGKPFTTETVHGKLVTDTLAKCEAQARKVQTADAEHATEMKAANDKAQKDYEAERQKGKEKEDAFWAKLKGDRKKVWLDQNATMLEGWPDFKGVVFTAPVWTWSVEKTDGVHVADCTRVVKFKGNKKVSDRTSGGGCNWTRFAN